MSKGIAGVLIAAIVIGGCAVDVWRMERRRDIAEQHELWKAAVNAGKASWVIRDGKIVGVQLAEVREQDE